MTFPVDCLIEELVRNEMIGLDKIDGPGIFKFWDQPQAKNGKDERFYNRDVLTSQEKNN